MNNVILVGNPNTGKTTLFNTLCKKNNHVGNWHGITTEISVGTAKHKSQAYSVYDLPGIYSLSAYSGEEKVAIDFLQQHKDYFVVCVVDANNLKRNLLLALELIENGYKVCIAINMAKEKQVDNLALQKLLGVNTVLIDARKTKSVNKIFDQNFENHAKYSYVCKLSKDKVHSVEVRFDFIDKVLSCCKYQSKIYGKSKLDKFLYNKFLAPIIFAMVMLCVFAITFGQIGQYFSGVIGNLFEEFSNIINSAIIKLNITAWAHSLIMNGLIAGVGVIVSFLPQVVLLSLCINFLENIGYLSRIAYMFDGFCKKIGLTGKSVLSILLGYGCTASAMLTTRALDNIHVRKRTALVLPFASCNAKLPIFLLIASVFFERYKVFVVFGLYIFSILVGILVSYVSSKIKPHQQEKFFIEIPPMRIQSMSSAIKNAFSTTKDFVKRVGTTLILCSIIVWVLSNIDFTFHYVSSSQNSMIYHIAKFISPIFAPIGLNNWGIVAALIIGLSAKEMIVSCLAITNGLVGNLQVLSASLSNPASVICLSPASAISFLVFVLLYSPCLSALSVMAKEISRKFALFVFAFQLAVAYVCSLIIYGISNLAISKMWIELAIILIVVAIFVCLMIKYNKKKSCNNCKGKCHARNCYKL